MPTLTERQKQILAGSMLLALGVVTGRAIAPDDPQRDEKLADLSSAFGSGVVRPGSPLDTAEYHRAVRSLRDQRPDLVDVGGMDVAPGELVTTEVTGMPLGARPESAEYFGPALGTFETQSLTFEDVGDTTTIRLSARNTSAEAARLFAFVRFAESR